MSSRRNAQRTEIVIGGEKRCVAEIFKAVHTLDHKRHPVMGKQILGIRSGTRSRVMMSVLTAGVPQKCILVALRPIGG
jgi:hypothetical protein